MYPRLMGEDEINRAKDKFNEDVDHALEEAIRKHVSIPLIDIDSYNTIAQLRVRAYPSVHVGVADIFCV